MTLMLISNREQYFVSMVHINIQRFIKGNIKRERTRFLVVSKMLHFFFIFRCTVMHDPAASGE